MFSIKINTKLNKNTKINKSTNVINHSIINIIGLLFIMLNSI